MKKLLLVLSIIFTILLITFISIIIINPFFKLELVNSKNITINYGDKYKEYGV